MFPYQQPTLKWKAPIAVRVLKNMKGKDTPHYLSRKLGETQASVSHAMYQLWQKGKLQREACPCGRGFVYWK